MSSIDIIRMGLKNLYRRKARTFLTVLGVIIGTAAIVIMISIGLGIKQIFIQSVSRYGSLTMINVRPTNGGQRQMGSGLVKGNMQLTDKNVRELSGLTHVVAVIPSLSTDGRLVSGKYVCGYANIRGIKPEHMKYMDLKMEQGRMLQPGDEYSMIFGGQVAMNFQNPKQANYYNYNSQSQKPKVDVMKDKIILTADYSAGESKAPSMGDGVIQQKKVKAKEHKINVIGLVKSGNYETDYSIFMNLDTVIKFIKEKDAFNRASNPGTPANRTSTSYQDLQVKVDDTNNMKDVQEKIKALGYEAYSPIDSLAEVEKVSNIIQLVLGGIAAISLFVASLGITNTMIMAIYERTREIGVMKVIGAQLGDIKKMFLFEAAIIGLLGGIVGLLISFGISFGLNNFLAQGFAGALGGGMEGGMEGGEVAMKMSVIPFWLMGFSLVFTTMIGIISGYYPAKRAMKLSAIEAIKIE